MPTPLSFARGIAVAAAIISAALSGCSSDPVAPPVSHTTESRTLVGCTVNDCRPVASRQIGSTTVRLTGAVVTPCAANAVIRAQATSQAAVLTVTVADSGGVRTCAPAGSPVAVEVLIRNVPSSTATLVVRGAVPTEDQRLPITTSSAAPN